MRLLAALAFGGLLLIGAPAQSAPPAESDLQRAADRLVAATEIPAVITLVEQDGKRTVVAAGEADIRAHTRAVPTNRFWVGSVTKSFIAVVVMQLVAERKLRLDDTVARLLPGRLGEGRRIRLRNLLNHTSGIPEYMQREPWRSAVARNPRVVIPARKLVSAVARLRGRLVPPRLVAEMTRVVPGSHGFGLGIFKLGSPCGRWFYGNTGGTPGYLTFAAGSRDGRRLYVLAVNGVDPHAMETIVGPFLDDLLCPRAIRERSAGDFSVTAKSKLGFFTAVITHPQPLPIEKLHTWKVRLLDRQRRPVTGARITVTGDMPAHGHGLPTTPIAVSRGRGRYDLQGMMFQMPGLWYVQLRVRSGGRVDRIRIRFTIAP